MSNSNDRLVSVTIDGWAPLRNAVDVSFAPERTIVAARDGRVASLICAGIAQGARVAVMGLPDPDPPRYFRCAIVTSAGQELSYAYDRRASFLEDDEPLIASVRWVERPGQRESGAAGESNDPGKPRYTGPGLRLVHSEQHMPEDAWRIHTFLSGVRFMPANLPRPEPARRKPLRLTGRSTVLWNARGVDQRIGNLASTLVLWFETQRDRFREIVDTARSIGALRALDVSITEDTVPHPEFLEPRHVASISVDGTDYSILSDSTLRVIEILSALYDPDATMLLIEEPEAAIEPRLHDRLLDAITAAARGRQVVLSTQSSRVVASAKPDELRLVEHGNRTTVRAVPIEEARRAFST
jgi:hypothetical protein